MGRKKKPKAKLEVSETPASNSEGTGTTETKSEASSSLPKESQDSGEFFECDISPIYGRFLKSKCEIEMGALILGERFLLAGPQRSSDIVCVGCHSDLTNAEDRKKCPRCLWPICSKICADSVFHKDECKFFLEKHAKPPTRFGNSEFGALTVLRGLMLKYQNPEGWAKLMNLEAHNDIRKSLPLWRENTINVVEIIRITWGFDCFTDEEAHTVCGILEVNAFELGEKSSYRGIFPRAAMMAHSCIPNTTRFDNPATGVLEIRAAVNIPPGEPLTVCYAFSLEATAQRRNMLQETKFFECICPRCNDPREMNSNIGTLLCQTCKRGDVINTGASDLTQSWVCQLCGSRVPQATIECTLLSMQQAVDNCVQDISSCEKFLKNCKAYFHPTHYIPFDVKFNLCQAYGRETTPLDALSPADLDRKTELCREVLKILDILTPGYTVTRGLILYELQAAEVIKSRRLQELRKGTAANLRRKLQLTLKILQESITILEFCHPASIEYEISQAAKEETLVDLQKWIATLK